MNKHSPSTLPDENKIEELLTKIQPMPSEQFHKKMEQASWRVGQGQSGRAIENSFRVRIAFIMMALVIIATLIATPQGRAWAQEVFQFFKKVNFTTIPISVEEQQWINAPVEQYDLPLVPVIIPTLAPEMMALAECQSPHNVQSYACQVAYAESKLSLDIKEFPKTPDGWIFKTLTVDISSQITSISYTHYSEHGAQFVLRQGLGKFPTEYGLWSMVPADRVETVNISSLSGEYVQGSFSLSQGDNAWRWNGEDYTQRLAWNDGTRWYYIEVWPPSPGHISRNQLIELAASLADSPLEQPDPLNLDSLSSISDAEKYSGLDLKAPTMLPLGYSFSYARYFSFNNEVHLHYNEMGGEDLVVYEWKGKPDNFDALANIFKNYEMVKVHGEPAFYAIPESVSQYESSYLFLSWRNGELNYKMYFYFDPSWGGGMLDKSKMLAIAESMDDINDYKRSDSKPYEYVDAYEKALGLDIKEFSTTPAGWSFDGVWAATNCIGLSYISTVEQGQLNLSQCRTDNYFDQTDIPPNAIENVKIGKHKGQYIIGNYGYDNNGVMTWQFDLPLRQLLWQEEGLWMQISLSGDSVILYNKEDLISYAESLR